MDRRGVGFAVGFKNVAYSEGFDDAAEATVTLTDGPGRPVAAVHTAAVDYGQGLYTVLAQIVRTELGVDEVVVPPGRHGGRARPARRRRRARRRWPAAPSRRPAAAIREELERRAAAT